MADLSNLGRYELRRTLGKGAMGVMGVVYEGYDPKLGRKVAVKTILQGPETDAVAQAAARSGAVSGAMPSGIVRLDPRIAQPPRPSAATFAGPGRRNSMLLPAAN